MYLYTLNFQKNNEYLFDILSNFENKIFVKKSLQINNPLFISGMPRSGTTLLADFISSGNDYGSFLYKDLPFFRIPIFWNKINKLYYMGSRSISRSHGDKLFISVNSPDAFEELIWSRFIENYQNLGFSKYLDENYEDDLLNKELKNYIEKVLYLRRKKKYFSKGNYNLFRIKYLNKIFKDPKFIVMFRNPFYTAISSSKVHERFMEFSKKNHKFTSHLDSLCHYEFGPNRKPIMLNNSGNHILEQWRKKNSVTGYLLQWLDIYKFVLNNYLSNESIKKNILLINYDDFIINHNSIIKNINYFLNTEYKTSSKKLTLSEYKEISLNLKNDIEKKLLNEINDVYQQLQEYKN